MLLSTLPSEKVLPANVQYLDIDFFITTITCIAGLKVGLHVKMTMSLLEKTTSRIMLEIGEYTKSNLQMDLLG